MSESKVKHREPPPIIPADLLEHTYTCEKCDTEQKIDWLQKQPFPKESVASDVQRGVHWVPISFLNTCACSHRNHIRVKKKELHRELLISADEASRPVDGIHMFLLAGCGISSKKNKS